MGNPVSQASKRTAVIAILRDVAVVPGTLLSVAALSLGDLMEIFPLFAPLVASPAFPFFHEVHDLLAVGVALYAAYKYHVRLGVVAILLFLIAHIPYIIAEFTEEAPEILRVLLGGFVALLGVWLIKQLQESQEQTEAHSQDARKERRFSHNVIATVPESLLVLDKDLKVRSANRSFYQLFQTNPENTIGRNLPSMLGEEAGTFSAELNRLFGTDDTLENFELHFQSERLGERIFNITARGIIVAEEEEEEEEEEELVVIRDITERKRAEEALRKSEENFRRSLDDSPLGIRIVNEDGETIYANQAMLDIYGYDSIEELKMTPTQKRYTPESYAEHQVRKEKRQGSDYVPSNYEVSIVRKDGEIRHLEVFRKEVLWNGHTQFQVLYNDVTERKRAEEALRQSEAFLSAMFNSITDFITVQDPQYNVIKTNQVVEQTFGKVVGQKCYQAYQGRNERCPDCPTFKVLATGKAAFSAEQIGHGLPFEIWAFPIRDRHGNIIAVIEHGKDITERRQAEKVLEESEARYRSLVHLGAEVGEAIVMLQDEGEREGLQAFCNEAWPRITGYSNKELLNMSFFDLLHPKDRDASLLRHRRKMSGEGIPGLYGVTIVRKDDSEIYVELTSARSTYQGKPTNVAYIRDVTERKQAEEALRRSESRYRLLAENLTDVIWTTDMELRITYVSPSVLRLRGYTADEAMTQTVQQILSPASYEAAMEAFAKEMDAEKTGSRKLDRSHVLELEVVHKDGSVVWTETTFSFLRDLEGRLVGIIGVSRDITERKQAEEEIRRLLDRESHAAREWQETFDAVTDIVMLISPYHELLRVNKTGCESMGKKPEELIGKKCYEVVHGLGAPIEQCPCLAALKTKKSHTSELTEQGRHYLLTAYPIFGEGGEVVAFAHIIKDITERKQAEETRLELERKAQNASRLASIGEMAAGIAHEINNPLTPVLGFSEILMKRELPEDIKSELKIIYDSTKRTADVTKRLLTFARQNKPMRVPCQINEVVESTLQLRAYHLKTNNIKVISELDAELPRTMADASQLQQVLLNLIMNAEYEMTLAHGGGNLLIKTESMSNIIRVSVKDDGPGISKENMDRLFTPFFTTKKVGEGTGLGLSVCHGIVAEHNGRTYAESEVGKGATFIVELPIVKQQKEKEAKPSESDTGEAVEAAKARILVVDDEPTIVQVIKQALTDEGYEVRATGKAKEALRLVKREKFACILLDIKLPDMSGIELYQHLDKTDKSSAQRIIFITGDVVGADTMDFFSGTRACYITKPFGIEQLKKEVKGKLSPEG